MNIWLSIDQADSVVLTNLLMHYRIPQWTTLHLWLWFNLNFNWCISFRFPCLSFAIILVEYDLVFNIEELSYRYMHRMNLDIINWCPQKSLKISKYFPLSKSNCSQIEDGNKEFLNKSNLFWGQGLLFLRLLMESQK